MVSTLQFSQYFKEKNVQIGLLLYAIITPVVYFTTFEFISGYLLGADLQFFLGLLFGVIYALRKKTDDQTYLKCGLIVGIIGGVLSAFIISLGFTLVFLWIIIDFFAFFGYLLITAIVIGLLIGGIISSYFMYTELKGDRDEGEDRIDDDFYKDLIEDNKK